MTSQPPKEQQDLSRKNNSQPSKNQKSSTGMSSLEENLRLALQAYFRWMDTFMPKVDMFVDSLFKQGKDKWHEFQARNGEQVEYPIPESTSVPITKDENKPKKSKKLRRQHIGNPGLYVDGWADLIENSADKANEVRYKIFTSLGRKGIKDVEISHVNGYTSLSNDDYREHTLALTNPGVTVMIYVAPQGTDLFVGWSSFIKPVINGLTIILILILSILASAYTYQKTLYRGEFFYQAFDLISYGTAAFVFILTAVILTLLISRAGNLFQGNSLAYFLIEPDVFDSEDIAALGLSVHKVTLRALDDTGIETAKLRLKQNFKRSRHEDVL